MSSCRPASVDAAAEQPAHQRLGVVAARAPGVRRPRRARRRRRASVGRDPQRPRHARRVGAPRPGRSSVAAPGLARPTRRRRRASSSAGDRAAAAAALGAIDDLGLQHLGSPSTAARRDAAAAERLVAAGRAACGTRGSRTAADLVGSSGSTAERVEVDRRSARRGAAPSARVAAAPGPRARPAMPRSFGVCSSTLAKIPSSPP